MARPRKGTAGEKAAEFEAQAGMRLLNPTTRAVTFRVTTAFAAGQRTVVSLDTSRPPAQGGQGFRFHDRPDTLIAATLEPFVFVGCFFAFHDCGGPADGLKLESFLAVQSGNENSRHRRVKAQNQSQRSAP